MIMSFVSRLMLGFLVAVKLCSGQVDWDPCVDHVERNTWVTQCPEGFELFHHEQVPDKTGPFEFQSDDQRADNCTYLIGDQVITCRRKSIRVRKCCPVGLAIDGSNVGLCVANSVDFNPIRLLPGNYSYFLDTGSSNETHMSLRCPHDYNLFLPWPIFVDNSFSISVHDDLIVPKGHYTLFRRVREEYCVDNVVRPDGNVMLTAAMCLPYGMDLMRWMLAKIYPHLHFMSVLFLVATLGVYFSYAKLRNNLLGYNMICFMLCMVIVQMEYGIITLLPMEPHTWCFAKVRTMGFFRLASSAWITVMGFDSWRKIWYCERLVTPKQMLRRGLYYSMYAWGLPTAITITIVLYLHVKYGGMTARTCWFGDPVVGGLIWYPNVTLVISNLIFFIPSAWKLYRSRSFLANSGQHMTRFETERIHAMFRLFILEEFYVIPRVVHWFVDADFTSPYLLMVSITCYVLLGPCVFCFFILKSDVLKMIRKSMNKNLSKTFCQWTTKESRSNHSSTISSTSQSTRTSTISINETDDQVTLPE